MYIRVLQPIRLEPRQPINDHKALRRYVVTKKYKNVVDWLSWRTTLVGVVPDFQENHRMPSVAWAVLAHSAPMGFPPQKHFHACIPQPRCSFWGRRARMELFTICIVPLGFAVNVSNPGVEIVSDG